ncbi:MAG: hypothetical protein ACLFRX_05790 [Gemmatimonadota bacterium]
MASQRPVLVHDAHGAPAAGWRRRFPPPVEFQLVPDWSELIARHRQARGLVVEVEDFRDWPHLESLPRLQRDPCLTPLVILTGRDPESLASLAPIPIERVVWRSLPLSEVEAVFEDVFGRLDAAAAVYDMPGGRALRRALRRLFVEYPPPRTVEEWARRTCWDRRTLWAHWTAAFPHPPPARLQDLVGWGILLAAVARKRRGRSWQGVCRDLGIEPRRLARLSRRLLETDLRGLDGRSALEIRTRFQDALAGSQTVRAEEGQIGYSPGSHRDLS